MGVERSRNFVVSFKVYTWRATVDIGMDTPHLRPESFVCQPSFCFVASGLCRDPEKFRVFAFVRLRFRRWHHYSACSSSNVPSFHERMPTVSVCPSYRLSAIIGNVHSRSASDRMSYPLKLYGRCNSVWTLNGFPVFDSGARVRARTARFKNVSLVALHRVPRIAGKMIKLIAPFGTTRENTDRCLVFLTLVLRVSNM